MSKPFYRKVGGIHFVRVWRLQFSFCLCKPAKRAGKRYVRTPAPLPPIYGGYDFDTHVWVGPQGVKVDEFPFATMVTIRDR